MRCPNCGKEIANDSVYCEYCGTKVPTNGKTTMSFIEAVKTCLNKYAVLTGRASRAEYWWFVLFNVIISIIAGIMDISMGNGTILFSLMASLALLLPGWSVAVRRCHDTNHSGWWLLCPIYNIILMFKPSDEGQNQYD